MSKNPAGMGAYKKRKDGRYEWSQMIDGKRRYVSACTLKELKQKVNKIADKPINSNKITFKEYADLWLYSRIKPLKEEKTYKNYKYHLESSVYPIIGTKRLQKINAVDVQNVIAEAHEKGRSKESMKHIKSVVISLLRQAKKDKLISDCPHNEDIEIPNTAPIEREAHTPREMAEILNALQNSRWLWSALYALNSGARCSEIVALKWTDIDREGNRIRNYNKKTKKIAYIPLTDEIDRILCEQRNMLLREGLGFSPYVFPNNKGDKTDSSMYSKAISRHAQKVGIKTSPHRFRHTFVYINKNNLTLSELQSVLGHSKSTHTLDIYGKILNENTDKIKSSMENAMKDYMDQMKRVDGKIAKIHEKKTGS